MNKLEKKLEKELKRNKAILKIVCFSGLTSLIYGLANVIGNQNDFYDLRTLGVIGMGTLILYYNDKANDEYLPLPYNKCKLRESPKSPLFI